MGPEGAPMPPECLVATRPAGAAPRPAYRNASRSALQVDEVMQMIREVGRVGISPTSSADLVLLSDPPGLWMRGQPGKIALHLGIRLRFGSKPI